MDKRYQVFISSTFTDLKDERQAVLKAILELDHMPAGMELFPASDDTAWQLIKDVIDASDYYVLIIGGRYGSQDEAGIGYTEKEYDYAVETKKPVIPLLHENPDNLPRERTETDEAAWEKLKKFQEKVENNHTCVYWNSPDDLKAKVIVGLTATVKRHSGAGWVRADDVPTDATVAEILELRRKIAELESERAANRVRPPEGTEDLQQGEDTFIVGIAFDVYLAGSYIKEGSYEAYISPTWNEIFAGVAPTMISEASDTELRSAFRRFIRIKTNEEFGDNEEFNGRTLDHIEVQTEYSDYINTCIVQLRALGLIRESTKQRSVRDTSTYWALTPYGDYLMSQLRAIRRHPNNIVEEESTVGDN